MTEPTPAELSRRFDEMRQEIRDNFRDIKKDLAEVPSLQAITALFEVRDTRIAAQDKRIDELTRALATEVSNRQAADREEEKEREKALAILQEKIDAGRKWLVGTIISAAGILIGIATFLYNLGGAPT